MNTVNIDGQVYDLVPRMTALEEQQQTFTPPHDINSEIPANIDHDALKNGWYRELTDEQIHELKKPLADGIKQKFEEAIMNVDDYPKAKDVSDVNNVLPLIKKVLEQQNVKGINKYGTALVDDKELSTLDYLKHAFEETIDLAQYLAVAINELEVDADDL